MGKTPEVVKARGFLGEGDAVCRWAVSQYSEYDHETGEDKEKEVASGTFHLYDGESAIYLGEEGAETLLTMLLDFLTAYNKRKGEVEA